MKSVSNVTVYSPTNKAKNDYLAVAHVSGRRLPVYATGTTSDEARQNALASIEGREFKFFNEQSVEHDFVPAILNFLNEPAPVVTVAATVEKVDGRSAFKNKVWYRHPVSGERVRATQDQIAELVEKGFVPGLKEKTEKSQKASGQDGRTGEHLKGKVWYHHPETLERLRATADEIEALTVRGFVPGIKSKAEKPSSGEDRRTGEHLKGKVWVHKGSDRKRVTEEEAEEFIAFGYEYGRGKNPEKVAEPVSEVSDTQVAPTENASPEASNEAAAQIVNDGETVSD